MPIKSGIGFGEAQVYNQPSSLTNLYGKLLQQQAKDQAQFATDLNNVMSKYSTKGLKDKDIELTAKAYQQIKDKVGQYSSRNPVDRARALAEARDGIQAIQEYADSALNAYKTLDQLAPEIVNNPWKYREGTGEAIKKLYELPYHQWGDDYKNINPSTFQRQPDNSSIYQMFNNVNADLSKIAPVSGKALDVTGPKHTVTYFNVKPEDALNNLYTTMELNPQAKYTLTHLYEQANPDKKDYTSADVANFGLQLYKQQFGDNAFKFYGGRTANSTGSGDKESAGVTNRGALLTKILNQVPGSDKELLNELNLPYGTKTSFILGGKDKKMPMLRVVVPSKKNEPMPASIANRPDLAALWSSDKSTVVDVPLNQPDSERGLNELINRYSTGDVKYTKVKGTKGGNSFNVDEYLQKKGLK